MIRIIIHILLLRPLVKLMFGINIFEHDNIRSLDRFVITANHNSHLDILLLYYLLPLKQIPRTHTVAAKKYFSKSKIVFFLVDFLFSPMWVTRDNMRSQAGLIDEIHKKLEAGHNIIIFPEGSRGKSGEIMEFKSGIGRVAEKFPDIPILPVFLSGPERSFPKMSLFPVPIWNNVYIGQPRFFDSSHAEITQYLEELIRDYSDKENSKRYKRNKQNQNTQSIAFLGIDGSGKSTISKKLAMDLSEVSVTALISDKIYLIQKKQSKEVNNFLSEKIRQYIGQYAKKAKSLKFYKVPKLIELFLRNRLHNELIRWYRPEYIMTDGSSLLNLVAWSVLYKKTELNKETSAKAIRILSGNDENLDKNDPIYKEYSELKSIKKAGLNHLNLPDKVIFIDTSPAVALSRVDTRGEQKQVHETEEKLAKLRNAYSIICESLQGELKIPTIVIDGDDSIESISKQAAEFINAQQK